ncbi:MAG: 4Fe-4S binding protein [Chloroflexi bacterium]|nr:4Fe-4S binding protein [Chloroflexota bacterium]
MLRCIFCGYCEDACPTEAIQLGHEHQMSYTDRRDAIYTKEMLIDSPAAGASSTPQQVEAGAYNRSIPDMEDPS